MNQNYGSRIDFHYRIDGRLNIEKKLRVQTDILKVIQILLDKHNSEDSDFNIDLTLNVTHAGN